MADARVELERAARMYVNTRRRYRLDSLGVLIAFKVLERAVDAVDGGDEEPPRTATGDTRRGSPLTFGCFMGLGLLLLIVAGGGQLLGWWS